MDATSGDPGGSRTPNPQIRSLMLYPVELRGRLIETNVLSRAQKRKQINLLELRVLATFRCKIALPERILQIYEPETFLSVLVFARAIVSGNA
jgi:hypothetical protein